MIQRYGVIILLVISLLSISMAFSREDKSVVNQEKKVLEAIEVMTSAFQQKDIEGVLKSYESGAVVMFEPGKRVTDSAVLRQMFEGAFQLNPLFHYPSGHEVFVANDIALHIAPWVMKGRTPDGSDIAQKGLSVAVLRKNEDGQWLLIVDNPHGQFLMDGLQ